MLRDFQEALRVAAYNAWNEGAIDILVNMATGAGKTVLFTHVANEFQRPVVAIAHRQELLAQAALAFNRDHVPHSIIAPDKILGPIIELEHRTHGYSTYHGAAPIRVAGIDTLIRRETAHDRWYSQVACVIQDEAHHQLVMNKWGRGRLMFPNALGYGTTAQSVRADNKGLGRKGGSGFIDRLIIGPHGRALVNRGFLNDYRVICAKQDVDFDSLKPGPSGELNQVKVRAITHSSKVIVGNARKLYMEHTPGQLGITFVCDKEQATKTRTEFQDHGIPAEIITDETPTTVRGRLMEQFRARKILMMISVDCLGEGVDVPAVGVIILARRTASWQILCQQKGRGDRPIIPAEYEKTWNTLSDMERLAIIAMSEKPLTTVIDLVGNIVYHSKFRGLPDSKQEYSLRNGENRRKSDAIPVRECSKCHRTYDAYLLKCKHCNAEYVPAGRSTPQEVEGDVYILEPATLALLRGEADRIMGPVETPLYLPAELQRHVMRNHHERFSAQKSLQHVMMVYGGWQKHQGRSEREAHKLFFLRFGVDILTAQGYNAAQAAKLEAEICAELARYNVQEKAA